MCVILSDVVQLYTHLITNTNRKTSHLKPEGRTWFRSLFPGLDRPPTPREAIPVLAVRVDEDLNLSGKHEKPR